MPTLTEKLVREMKRGLDTIKVEVETKENKEVTLTFYEPPSMPPLILITWYKDQRDANHM